MPSGDESVTSVSKLEYLFWGDHQGGGDDLVLKKQAWKPGMAEKKIINSVARTDGID